MPEEYGDFGLKIPKGDDEKTGADVPLAFQDFVDSLDLVLPTIGVVGASAALANLPGAYEDVPGAKVELTTAVAAEAFVVASFELEAVGANAEAIGTLGVDGVDHPGFAKVKPSAGTVLANVAGVYAIALAAGKHVLQLRVKHEGGGSANCYAPATRFIYAVVGS